MRRLLIIIASEIILIIGILVMPRTLAQVSSSFPYCNGNYVVPGGINRSMDMSQIYRHPRVSGVYSHFGITPQDMSNFNSEAVNGTVTKSGNVMVNGQTVANNAITAGCNNMAGSTAVSNGNMTFYTRPPSVSFASSSLPAYVVMRNGQFKYAIIADCGNPVMATPVTPSVTPQPRVRQAAPTTPAQTQAQNQTQTQTQSQSVNVLPATTTAPTVSYTPPAQTSTVTYATPSYTAPTTTTTPTYTAPTASKTTLPNTGAGNVVALAAVTTTLGTVAHWLFSRRISR